MPRPFKILLFVAVLLGTLWYGANRYAEHRVRTVFLEAGMTDEAAACMGRRFVERLSLRELHRLMLLQDEARDTAGLVRAASIEDRRIARVAGTSALLCSTGLAR